MIDVTKMIETYYSRDEDEKPRAYIGASSVGHDCTAMLSYSHRGYPNTAPDQKLKRIFRDGHRIEYIVISDMAKAGVHVMEKDPLTGKQWRYTDYHGNAMGNADGIMETEDGMAIVEIKSMNDAKFKEFSKKGVKYSHPMYYAQMQYMMGLSNIEKAVLVSYNKNTSDYHHEWVDFEIFYYNSLKQKVENIILGHGTKISHDEADWRCRGCFKRDACWQGKEPEKTMRTCGNATSSLSSADWTCSKGCVDVCKNWVRYEPNAKT